MVFLKNRVAFGFQYCYNLCIYSIVNRILILFFDANVTIEAICLLTQILYLCFSARANEISSPVFWISYGRSS